MKKLFKNFLLTLMGVFLLTGKAYATHAGIEHSLAAHLDFLKDVEIHAFAAASYNFNFNEPADRANRFRVFDTDANTFKFDAGELVLLKETPNPGDTGFRFDLKFGFSQPEVNQASPGLNVNGTSVSDIQFDTQQGYVSYKAPIGSGLQLDLGKFITHIGAEVMDGYDGFNYTLSRSMLFSFGPFTHTGLRATYTVNDKISVLGMIANGWDNQTDNNGGKTFGGQIALTPWEGAAIYLNWAGGPEPQPIDPKNEDDYRNIFDLVAEVSLTDKTLVNLNLVYGKDDNAIAQGDNAEWWGISTIFRHDVNNWLSLNVRGQFFNDVDGFRSGAVQNLWATTFSPEIRVSKNMVFRMEYRHDESDEASFDDNGAPTHRQDTAGAQAIFLF